MADLYSYFIERGIQLLNNDGVFGIIVANKWLRANYGEPLRKFLKAYKIKEITDFGDLPVFEGATAYPCILICEKSEPGSKVQITNIKTLKFESLQNYISTNKYFVNHNSLENEGWNLSSQSEIRLLKKLDSAGISLDKYLNGRIFRGVLTGLNEAFVINGIIKNKLIKADSRSAEVIKPFLTGREVKKYQIPAGDHFLIFFPKGFTNRKGKRPSNAWKWLTDNYPAIATYLKPFEAAGKKRFDKGDYWWELRSCDYYEEFEKKKIIYPNILKKPEFTFDTKNWFTNQKCFIIPTEDKYLLGFLNSKINYYLFEKYLPKLRGGFYEPSYVFFKKFPIKQINPSKLSDKKLYTEIIESVNKIIELKSELSHVNLQSGKEQIEAKVEHFETKIDFAFYRLYDFTQEEIDLIEKNSNNKKDKEVIVLPGSAKSSTKRPSKPRIKINSRMTAG